MQDRCLRYEIFWERDPDMKEIIDTVWRDLGPLEDLGSVSAGLQAMMQKLHIWGRRKFGNVSRELHQLRTKLKCMQDADAPRSEIRALTDLMNELLYKEEMLWLQRSCIDWLREGDRNTKFFHQKAVWHARRNKIMQCMVVSYFKSLYTRDPSLDSTPITSLIPEQISEEMNESLCKDFTDEEISDALFQIGPIKAPGPDGFPARFY
jgi:hypothetical protein